ncbi:MAG: 30S ribosomal protein S18 [bacterium]
MGNRIIIPRRKTSELNKLEEIPYKDVELLKNYLTERGRILPRRITGNTARTQRALKTAIKRARNIALLSFAEGFVSQD